MSYDDDIKQILKTQKVFSQKLDALTNRVYELEKRLGYESETKPVSSQSDLSTSKPVSSVSSVVVKHKSSSDTGFKVFGVAGFLLLILGFFYLYNLAVSEGWIGIFGRVVIGLLSGVFLVALGYWLFSKIHKKYGSLLIGGGTGLVYFTVFSTYYFEEFRTYFGSSLLGNTIILFLVAVAGLYLALKLDQRILGYVMLCLAYFASLLSGGFIAQSVSSASIFMLVFSALILSGLALLLQVKKAWDLMILPVIANYLLLFICLFYLHIIGYPLMLFYLILFFIVHVALLFFESVSARGFVLSIFSGLATLIMGLYVLPDNLSYFDGFFALFLMALYFIAATIGLSRKNSFLYSLFLSLAVSMLAASFMLFFDGTYITVSLSLLGYMIFYFANKYEIPYFLETGILVFIVTFIKFLLFDLASHDSILSTIVLSVTLFLASYHNKPNLMFSSSILVLFFGTLAYFTNPDLLFDLSSDSRHTIVTILWSLYGLVTIVYGYFRRSSAVRIFGIVLFCIAMIKLLLHDLASVDSAARVILSMVVGVLLLVGSYVFVKNKDKIEDYFSD